MGRKLDKFLLLMWKNFLIQWRHPKQTAVEILAPVLFASLLVVIRGLVDPEPHEAVYYQPFENKIPVMANLTTLRKIAWAPWNSDLEKIMNDTVNAISTDENFIVEHMSFENIELMNSYLSNELNLLLTLAGVEFEDSFGENNELTPNFKITLRFPGELREGVKAGSNQGGTEGFLRFTWKTNLLFPIYQIPGPRHWRSNEGALPSYYYEGFLKLQQELSFAIIKHFKKALLNEDFNRTYFSIEMQRYPYPKWTKDVLLTALQTFVGLIIMLSFVYTCISTVKIITIEKEKQLKEAMKIMGLPNWLHWLAWFVKSLVMLIITMILVVIIMKAKWYPGTDYTVFTQSNPFIIFLFLLFYSCATITFCFAISVFFSKANTAATIAGMAWFLSYFPYSFLQDKYDSLTLTHKLLTSLCSNSAMAYGFQLVLMFEGIGEGLQWHNIWKSTSPDDDLVLGYLMVMLTLDTFIYLLVALYVEAIFPGDYGVPKPWYFPVTTLLSIGKTRHVDVTDNEENPRNKEFFEKEPSHLDVGIKIHHLHKTYSNKKTAVKDLSLNMYENQITVLLGHNGAGKTTTMSMLTGMIPPTSGTATICGYDIQNEMPKVRDSLGLCPQHNILFDELTVKEHLYFYSKLKGYPKSKIKEEVAKYVELLELVPKANALSSTLSGGMKRKLSVGVALCGDSHVVMFDEPTAGMDPAARRALWDLLQSQKHGRTILLTTHFMDEADLLGDRIAIMAGGKLKCCGSSFFLKKKYGAGYHLILDKLIHCNVGTITELLQKHLPDVHIESNIGSELTYLLNENQSSVFEEMLSDLETHSSELGVLSYGISLTTLEEVFMKVGAETSHENGVSINSYEKLLNATSNENANAKLEEHTKINGTHIVNLEQQHLITGWPLWRNQIIAMFMKRGLSILRSWLMLVIQICIPIMFLVLAIVVVRGVRSYGDLPKLKMQYQSYGRAITALTSTSENKYSDQYKVVVTRDNMELVDWGNENFTTKIIRETETNPTTVRLKYIGGATYSENNSTRVWFNNEPYHSPPLALQSVINSIFQVEVSRDHFIQVYNHPLPFTINTKFNNLARGHNMGFQIAFNIGFSMAFVSSFYIMFYIRERVSKSKHLQFVSGVDVIAFWGSSFICDLLTFIFTSLCIIGTLIVFQEDGFTTFKELSRTFSVLLYFGFSMLPLMYLCSYLFEVPSTGYTRMTLVNIFTGVAGFLIVQVLASPELELENVSKTLHWIFLLVPHYSLSTGIRDINMIYASHKLCDTMINSCVNFELPQFPRLSREKCKEQLCKAQPRCCTLTTNYYDWNEPGIGRNVVFSITVGIFLIAIVLMVEYRVFENICYAIQSARNSSPPETDPQEDSDVKQEREKINAAKLEDIKRYNIVMKNVTKYYKDFLAVNNICLGVTKYECFGLLGINGAGKTTTFKMMTGDIEMSSGDAWVDGFSLKNNMKSIHQMIGYCPQFDALLDDLTSRETLKIFCLIRGISLRESNFIAENLGQEFDFYQHLDKKVKELSGGNKRKLSTAITLIGNPIILYLDEPTTGMDPATKRYLWNALCKVRDNGKCIILTSHSMEECEALCTRLAIMVNGKFTCLGSTQHLKSKFSEGYTLIVKVMKTREMSESVEADMQPIEEFVKNKFKGALTREKHQELITFYIADKSLPWSKMFGIMENGKKLLNIEDYSLGQCSLEQVFLSFTKYQREE